MSTFETEEKRRTSTYDLKIIKWLFGFVKPHRIFFLLSLILMIGTALFEVAIPYLTKKAVDNYIYSTWIKTSDKEAIKTLSNKYSNSLIKIDNENYLVDLSKISNIDRTNIETLSPTSNHKYVVINIDKFPIQERNKTLKILEARKNIFRQKSNIYYAQYGKLSSLSKNEISIIRSDETQQLKKLALFIFLSLLGIFIFTSSFTYLLYYSGHKIMHSIRTNAFSHILKLPQTFFDKNPVGRVTTRVTNDVNAINEMYTLVLVQFFKDLIVIAGIITIMFSMNANLTFIILALTFFLGIVAAVFRMKLKRVFREIRITIGKLNAFVQESIRGIVLIKLYGKEKSNYKRFKDVNSENLSANMSQLWVYAIFRPFIEYTSILATALILWYGGANVINQNLTLGSLIAFLYYVRMVFKPIQELSERYNIFQSAVAASENLYDIVHEKIEESGSSEISKSQTTVEFKNVWFSYNKKDWVLKNVSFKIAPGETVALVGLTGSGKTTIVNLLLKFYKVQKGEILFNGVNINSLDNKSLRENITAVFQDLFLFGKDVSGEQLDMNKIEKDFGLHKSLMDSKKLSSGENQVISLAKAFSKKSRLLIMDEATSHIDADIEKNIQNIIRSSVSSESKLIIAHRLSNVRSANKIIVIHKGKIVESGKHYDLLKKKGIYANLHNFQKEVEKASFSTIH